ncbi:MAG TPA: 2-oxoglutarate dehydrogenase complex dihydrolipoyllysine-residue succinyltransferase [Ktedonobacterales bacterium]
MSVEVIVPSLGESIVEATVGRWLKSEGDSVAIGDPLVELETDKVNMEVAASAAGILQRILRRVGETVNIGEALAVITNGDEAAPSVASPAPQRVLSEHAARAEAPAGQAAQTLPATTAAAPASAPSAPAAASPAAAPTPAPAASSLAESGAAYATPLAHRVAQDEGVNLAAVHGTGPGGRITHEDVTQYLAHRPNGSAASAAKVPPPAATAPAATAPATAPATSVSSPRPAAPSGPFPSSSVPSVVSPSDRLEERIPMSRRRTSIAANLVRAQQTTAMLTTFNEIDMSAVMELRKRRRDEFKQRYGVGLGFMSFFTKAVVGALKAFPRLNDSIDGNTIVEKHYYDIGIAVNTPEGLVVPVVRNADRLSFAQIEREVATLAEKARNKTLSLDELQGGTFTITNGGVFGSLFSTPILNYPQVGILGMHKILERPIARSGQVVIAPMMYVALTYDHRLIDGADAVGFLVRVKELIEDPERLLLEG